MTTPQGWTLNITADAEVTRPEPTELDAEQTTEKEN